MKIKPDILIIGGLIIFLLFLFLNTKSEKYVNRFSGLAYKNECEFNPACLWDTARWVQLTNGMEGVCTLQGMACPAFSKDHDTSKYLGKSPTMVDNEYNTGTHASINYYPRSYAGETALEMLV